MLKQLKRQRGIGLLELMLSLSIIAILLVMATRYFMAANESQKLNNAISQVSGIAGGMANYDIANPGYKNLTGIKELVEGHYVPASLGGNNTNGKGANPWAGDLNLTVTPPGFKVEVTNVPTDGTSPNTTCDKLANMVDASNAFATCSGGNVTITYR